MDPLTLGIALCYALWHMSKAVKATVAAGGRAAAARADGRTAAMRNSPNRATRAAGHARHGWTTAGGAIDRGLRSGAQAAKEGLQEGWGRGRERGEERRTMSPQERYDDKIERRRLRDKRKRDRFDAAKARREKRQAERRGRLSGQTDPPAPDADSGADRDGSSATTDGAVDPACPPASPVQPQPDVPLPLSVDPDVDPLPAVAVVPQGLRPRTNRTDTPPSTDEGAPPMSSPMPTGEIQGKADTERALAAYRGAATAYQDDLDARHQRAQDAHTRATRVAEQLDAAELGQATMAAVAGVQEATSARTRTTAWFGSALEDVLAALAEFDASVAAHDTVEAAAVANTDGGTTDFHAA